MSVWWGGAESAGGTDFPNSGIKGVISVTPQTVPSGQGPLAVWVAESMINGPTGHQYWAQVGYYFTNSSTVPTAFAQCWDITTDVVLPGGSGVASLTTGTHEFSMYWSGSGTVWNFAVDGKVFFSYDLGATTAYSSYDLQDLTELQGTSLFAFNTINIPICFDVLQGGVWNPVTFGGANITNTGYAPQGQIQNPALPANSINIGSSIPQIALGTALWSGTGGGVLAVAATASPTSGSAPLAVAFISSPSGGSSPYSFSWSFGDGSSISTAQNPSHTYQAAGMYTATVTVTDLLGHMASNSVTISVTTPTMLSVSASASVTSGLAPLAVSFVGSATGGVPPYSYLWNFGDGSAVSIVQSPSHTFSSAGTFTVTFTATDAVASSASKSFVITVTAAPLTYSVTFSETGLPVGASYRITVDRMNYAASAGTAITLSFASGSSHTYSYQNRVKIGGTKMSYCTNASGTVTVTASMTITGTYSPC